ncbi:SseB family protein [Streptomyces sp. NBS 14/10]|uniref:SseB family protein n=1 Tax=Streptomyces sp. NBS 14/10 TaxID=1945643 RepID=UPI000B7D2D2A|nr:SseB family protein [Streptomyces sp. NBS 14/10]KAK1183304.1 SseB family protein [Streptomyces sp. NBS 14/10]
MALKNIPDPGFSGDDGSADPRLTAALAAWADDPSAELEVLGALTGARLLVPVVALLGEVEEGPDGLRREKTSDMAVPTLQAPDGRRALPAFTSLETLARWRADARPVAVPLRQALEAAAHEKADTVVLDLAGPVPYQLTGPALLALAEGRTSADPLADPAVAEALRTVLAAEPGVLRAHLTPAADSDGILALTLDPGAPAPEAVRRVAEALAADETLRARLVRGLDLALLPPGTPVPGEPLFSR